jgi:hypothetical protein
MVLLGLALLASSARAGDNETTRFLGPEADWKLARLELKDVHGLWGGAEIAVAGSGSACVRLVDKVGEERRFVFALSEKEALELVRLAASEDLLAQKPPQRQGKPDETRPELVLENALGLSRSVLRWGDDKVPALEKVEQALRALEKKTEKLDPVFRGKKDPYFRPLPGVQVTVALYSGRPDPSFELVRQEDWEKLRALTKDLEGAERPSEKDAPGLGYHGFLLTPRNLDGLGLAKWTSVYKGTLQLGDSPRERVYKKDQRGLEDWLKAEAKKRGFDVARPR